MEFGIHLHPEQTHGSLDEAGRVLREYCELGFEWVELALMALDLIYGGRLNRSRLGPAVALTRSFGLKYTAHAPLVLNLMDVDRFELQTRAFRSCIDACDALGVRLMVCHAGVLFRPWRPPSEPPAELASALRRERDCLWEMAEYARARGVTLAIENANAEPGMVRGDYYAYAARVDDLAAQVRSVDHPAVVMAFDFGHARTSASFFGFDWVGSLVTNQGLVRHWHMYDTFGRENSLPPRLAEDPESECFYGLNDLHIPIGWGDTPYERVLPQLSSPSGVVVLEVKSRYRAEFAASLAAARRLWSRPDAVGGQGKDEEAAS